jgi:hypothetical protein
MPARITVKAELASLLAKSQETTDANRRAQLQKDADRQADRKRLEAKKANEDAARKKPLEDPVGRNIFTAAMGGQPQVAYVGILATEDENARNQKIRIYTLNGQASAEVTVGVASSELGFSNRTRIENGVEVSFSSAGELIQPGCFNSSTGTQDALYNNTYSLSVDHDVKETGANHWYKITVLPVGGQRLICHVEFANELSINQITYSFSSSVGACQEFPHPEFPDTLPAGYGRNAYYYQGWEHSTSWSQERDRGSVTWIVSKSGLREITPPAGFADLARDAVPSDMLEHFVASRNAGTQTTQDGWGWEFGLVGLDPLPKWFFRNSTTETPLIVDEDNFDLITGGGPFGIKQHRPAISSYGMPDFEQGITTNPLVTYTAGIFSDLQVMLNDSYDPNAQPNFPPEGTPAYFPTAPAPTVGLALTNENDGVVGFQSLVPTANPNVFTRQSSKVAKLRFPQIPQDEANSAVENHIAWDWGNPAYCREQLLALGFSPADLTP